MEQNQSFQEMVERYRQQLFELQRRSVPVAEENLSHSLTTEPVIPASEPLTSAKEDDILPPFFNETNETAESSRDEPVISPSCSDLWV